MNASYEDFLTEDSRKKKLRKTVLQPGVVKKTHIFDGNVPINHKDVVVDPDNDDHPRYFPVDGSRAVAKVTLTPQSSCNGPEGTIYYDVTDKHVYVGVAAETAT